MSTRRNTGRTGTDLNRETKPGCFPIPWVTRAVLPTGKERGAAEHASNPTRPEKARKKSCTPPDTVGCAVIDSFTVRQTTERSQRDLAASGMFFNHQGCDSPKSRTELPVVLCKGTGRREAQGARGTTPGTILCDTRGGRINVSGRVHTHFP